MITVKTLLATGIVSLLQIATASAQSVNADSYITCRPKLTFQGDATAIEIKKGSVDALPAQLSQGAYGNVSTTSYVVKKTESDDFTQEFYRGCGISLTVNLEKTSAELTALVAGKIVKLSDLTCTFNENDPRPGVTMGN